MPITTVLATLLEYCLHSTEPFPGANRRTLAKQNFPAGYLPRTSLVPQNLLPKSLTICSPASYSYRGNH